ncbi:MAG: DUF1565 domain-containing protein [Deltaproteobacteria bacterium]|nr:MAG: DUF1565 domain-containing protein [Deltaproteobacteria bacterium]
MQRRKFAAGAYLLAGAVAVAPNVALAAEYYVATDGSDAGAGTAADPWATLAHAASVVAPGDVVHVLPGNYAGFTLETSGTEGAPIRFVAEPGVIIDTPGPTGDGIRLQNVSDVVIEGFRIVGMPDRGIAHRGATPDAPSRRLVIRGNVIEMAAHEGMYLSEVADSIVEYNTITDVGTDGPDVRGHCIYLANAGSDGTTIRGNELARCLKAGVHFNGDASIGGDGVISGLVIERNWIHDNAQNGLNMDGVQDSVIAGNVIEGNASNGIRAYRIDAAEGPRDLVIVANTIVVPSGGGWCVRITEEAGNGGSVVFDNVLTGLGDFGGAIALDGTPGFASDYNVVTGSFSPDRGDTLLDLAGWQGLGYDGASIVADPQEVFVDVGGGDFHLRDGAVAIDFGVDTYMGRTAPSVDMDGRPRPLGGAIDAGAYEYCPPGDDCTGGGTGGTGATTGAGGTAGTSTTGGGSGAGTAATGSAGSTGASGETATGSGAGSGAGGDGCGCDARRSGRTGGALLVVLLVLGRSRRQGSVGCAR